MPTALARVRRAVGRLVAPPGADPEARTVAGHATAALTVRALTADDADLRLLLDVRLRAAGDGTDAAELERVVHALVVPATQRWVRRHDLAALRRALAPVLEEVGAAVRTELGALGVELLAVELVGAEHLLASPSGKQADGPG